MSSRLRFRLAIKAHKEIVAERGADNIWQLALPITLLGVVLVIGIRATSWSMKHFGVPVAYAGSVAPPTHCDGPLSQRLVKAAMDAPTAAQDDGTLYGMQRWRKPTGRSYLGLKFPGLLSCAYTVSAIFREACHPIGEIASVNGVDAALVKWQKVRDARKLNPGDVVFWKPVPGNILGLKCPGRWHVGISLGGDSTVDNDWWSGKPKKGSLERACTTFAFARRPPR